jgi:hypothetical protein
VGIPLTGDAFLIIKQTGQDSEEGILSNTKEK